MTNNSLFLLITTTESDFEYLQMALSWTDHTISLSHLLNEGTTWKKFHLLGVSGRDGLLYIVAYTDSEVGVFAGSYILPNSWKLTDRQPTTYIFIFFIL